MGDIHIANIKSAFYISKVRFRLELIAFVFIFILERILTIGRPNAFVYGTFTTNDPFYHNDNTIFKLDCCVYYFTFAYPYHLLALVPLTLTLDPISSAKLRFH